MRGLLLVVPSLLRSMGSRRAGFSSCGVWALEHRLSSCGAQASLHRGRWDLPGPGLEPMSPALAGIFPTTVPPGKPSSFKVLKDKNQFEIVLNISCEHSVNLYIFLNKLLPYS